MWWGVPGSQAAGDLPNIDMTDVPSEKTCVKGDPLKAWKMMSGWVDVMLATIVMRKLAAFFIYVGDVFTNYSYIGVMTIHWS